MSFLNPAFLYGVLLIGVPLLIHLIRRRKLKVIQWAAMEFLRQSQKKQRRRLRIEELILLALRMLIVAIAALAFARPVLRSLGIPLLSRNARIYAVIVLDNSFSMGQHGPDGKTGWERAQAAAEGVLTRVLKSGDAASLVLLSDKPEALVNKPSYDLALVRQRVRTATLSDRATDYYAGAQAVSRLLNASDSQAKEVYWLTDDQANAWETSKKESARNVWQEISQKARITWVSVGAPKEQRDNLVIETPTLGRELVTPQLPARIEARVVNYGAKAQSSLLVNLLVDGKPAGTTRVSVAPGQAAVASFPPYRFLRPGTHIGQITLADPTQADELERDNVATFAVRTRERIRALVLDPRPNIDPAKSESFYVMNALAPGGAAESIVPKLREGEGLGNLALRDYDAVVVTGVTGFSEADRRALTEYVKTGGGLLLFPGPNTSVSRFNTELDEAGLLPAKLGVRRTLREEEALTLNPATLSHTALSLFKDTSTLNIASARFTNYYPLAPVSSEADPNLVQVMARFSNGDPAFVERKVDLGKVILAASSAGSGWNQLPLKPSFVPLAYQLLSYLGQGATSRRNVAQDDPLFLTLPLTDANKPVRVTAPDGKTTAQSSQLEARGVTFTYATTSHAGIYQVAVQDSKTQDAFSVGLPAAESDVAYAEPMSAATQAGVNKTNLVVAESPSQLQTSIQRSRYGVEVWRPLIWLLLPLLFLESFLAQRFGRRG